MKLRNFYIPSIVLGLSSALTLPAPGQDPPAQPPVAGSDSGDLVEYVGEDPPGSADLASYVPGTKLETGEAPEQGIEPPVAGEAAPAESEGTTPPSPSSAEPASKKKVSLFERTNLIIGKIRDNERAVDPFGLPMDPGGGLPSMSLLADQYDEIQEESEVSNTSLASALQELSLTGAYPSQQKIVVGPKAFKRGEMFGMRFGELTLRIRFEGIEKKKVYFRDMDTKELAFLDFSPKPQQFEPMYGDSQLRRPNGIDPMDKLFIVN